MHQPAVRLSGIRPVWRRVESAAVSLAAFVLLVSGCSVDRETGVPETTPPPASPTASATPGLNPGQPGLRLLQPTTTIVPATGCTVLTPGMNGVKVKMVQRWLGFPAGTWETMDSATIAAVRAFQQQAGLTADGVVGPITWRAMGFSENFCFDAYQAVPVLPATAGAHQRREQMIAFANGFLGEEYVWGGAGPRGYGIDCSGLVLQALYSAGLDPQPITVDKHVLPEYRTSLELYEHPRLAHLPRSAVSRGDLVFWRSDETGRVNHVAIYLGDGKVLEAVEPKVQLGQLGHRPTQTLMPEVVRPFGPTPAAA